MRVAWAVVGVLVFSAALSTAATEETPIKGLLSFSKSATAAGVVVPTTPGQMIVNSFIGENQTVDQVAALASSTQVEVTLHRWLDTSQRGMIPLVPSPSGGQPSRVLNNVTVSLEELTRHPQVFFSKESVAGEVPAWFDAVQCSINRIHTSEIRFPARDTSAVPDGFLHFPVTPDRMYAGCHVNKFRAPGVDRVYYYGMNLVLESDAGSERVRTGSWEQVAPAGPPGRVDQSPNSAGQNFAVYQVTQVLELRRIHLALDVNGPMASNLTLFAPGLDVTGRLSVAPSNGTLEWGAIQAAGEIDAFDANGFFQLRPAPQRQVSIEGRTRDAPTLSAASASAPVPWAPVVVAAVGAGVLALLAWLAWPLFSRFAGQELLEHPRRQAIVDWVRREPGIDTAELARRLGLRWSKVAYHVRRLEHHGHIAVRRIGRRTAVFPPAGFRGKETSVALLRRDSHRRIVDVLRVRPGLSQSELAEQLGRHQSQVSRLLNDLAGAGVVRAERHGRCTRYSVGELVAA